MWICWTYLLLFLNGEFIFSEAQTPRWIPLVGLKGGSVVFPVPVSETDLAIMRTDRETIVSAVKGQVIYLDSNLTNTVVLDSQKGYFTFHNLRIGDSGKYDIETMESSGKRIYSFQLTVYEDIPKPQVTLYDRSSCTWMCSVLNGRDVTLAWYEENVLLNQTSGPDGNISLSLLLQTGNSSTYKCVAANPVSNQTSQLLDSDIQQHCVTLPAPGSERNHTIIICVTVLSVVCVILIGGVVLSMRKRRHRYNEGRQVDNTYQNCPPREKSHP